MYKYYLHNIHYLKTDRLLDCVCPLQLLEGQHQPGLNETKMKLYSTWHGEVWRRSNTRKSYMHRSIRNIHNNGPQDKLPLCFCG